MTSQKSDAEKTVSLDELATDSGPNDNKITSDKEIADDTPSQASTQEDNNKPTAAETQEEQDPNLVTWDGPNDPNNPKTWSFKKKWAATALVSLITFMTPMASSMIAPAADAIANDLDVHSTFISQLIFSIFLLAFVIGPLFLAPLSETYGRVILLQLANIWFLIFNLACGFAQTSGQMLAFRFLSGLGACAPQSIGSGTLSDMWAPEERGKAVALYTLMPILSPSLGPLLGAWITEKSTWRWCFWSLTIFGTVVQVLVFFTLRETFAPRILGLKVARLRKETGNPNLHTQWEKAGDRSLKTIFKTVTSRVFIFLATEPIVQYLALYLSLVYGIIYIVLSTYPTVWTDIYHESTGIGGLNYISNMIGATLGAQIAGQFNDRIYRRLRKSHSPDGVGRAEFRVPLLWISTFLIAAGLFMYGWSAQYHTQWIVPNIGIAIYDVGVAMTVTGIQMYAMDSYGLYTASAVGGTAVARSITGFSFPLFAQYMYDALGEGWGNSLLAFLVLGIGYVGSVGLWFFGQRMRRASKWASHA